VCKKISQKTKKNRRKRKAILFLRVCNLRLKKCKQWYYDFGAVLESIADLHCFEQLQKS